MYMCPRSPSKWRTKSRTNFTKREAKVAFTVVGMRLLGIMALSARPELSMVIYTRSNMNEVCHVQIMFWGRRVLICVCPQSSPIGESWYGSR